MNKPVSKPSSAIRMLQQCGNRFIEQLQKHMQTLFESVDDTLFDMAERAENNAVQSEFFDGMREIRKQRRQCERDFRQYLEQGFKDFLQGQELPGEDPEEQVVDESRMSLIDDADLEQTLALSDMVAKGENRFARQLFALNQRFGAALEQAPPDDKQNPLAPAFLCQCLRQSATPIQVETRVLILLYKLFDKHLISQLEPLYQTANHSLVEGGILPQLPQQRSQSQATAAPSAADARLEQPTATEGDGQVIETGAQPTAEPAALHTQVFNTIRQLLAARHPGADLAAPTPPAATESAANLDTPPAASTGDLVNALSLLQTDTAITPDRPYLDTQAVKQAVVQQVRQLAGDDSQVNHDDEDTIDLVAMLFDFILQDHNLPDAMQALLSRLQIPFVKVALLDRALFAQKSHPARCLLDLLAETCVGWSKASDRGDRLYREVAQIVERVITDFDDDLGLFDRLLEDFKAFIEQYQRRAQMAEKRATEATKGRERLQAARQLAAEQIKTKLTGKTLPPLIDEILRKPWANALVITLLRHGQQSEQWHNNVKVVDDLIWSAESKSTAADVARLQSMLPHLAKQMRVGLEMVAYTGDDIKRLFADLKALYQSMIAQQYREHLTMPSGSSKAIIDSPPPTAVVLPVAAKSASEDLLEAADVVVRETASGPVDQACVSQVRQLEPGTWVEFVNSDSERLRAKLSWKSPITGKYLFVDQKGIKVADKDINMLAAEVRAGETVILANVALFDRAMDAIADRLQDDKAEPTARVSGQS